MVVQITEEQASPRTQNQYNLKFEPRRTQPRNIARDNILAIPKQEYQGKDFF